MLLIQQRWISRQDTGVWSTVVYFHASNQLLRKFSPAEDLGIEKPAYVESREGGD